MLSRGVLDGLLPVRGGVGRGAREGPAAPVGGAVVPTGIGPVDSNEAAPKGLRQCWQ